MPAMYKAIYPQYPHFKCIADKCPIGCCFFRIDIFKEEEQLFETKAIWRDIDGKGNSIRKYLEKDCKGYFFKSHPNGKCIFCNDRKLCDIQLRYGENPDNLPLLCRTYPRIITALDGRTEYALEPCCPVAAASVKDWETGEILIEGEKTGSTDKPTMLRDSALRIISNSRTSLRDCLIELSGLYGCGLEIPQFEIDGEREEFLRKETALMIWTYMLQYDGMPEIENLMEFIISFILLYIDTLGSRKYDSWWDMCVDYSRSLVDYSTYRGFIVEHEERYGDVLKY